MNQNLENSVKRYEELTMLLVDPTIINDQTRYLSLVKEFSELEPLVKNIKRLQKVEIELEENKFMLHETDDQEFRDLIRQEITQLQAEKTQLESDIQTALIPKDPMDEKNVIVEIRAGAGGDEAALFAGDLFRMYTTFAENQNWQYDLIDVSENEIGGFKEVIFEIIGQGAYSKLKYESGVHRVQRVPETESGGRVHTSTVTVAVLPEAEAVDIEIDPSDLDIDTYRASGAGGQHVNKTSSAIRITHLPSGMVVTCQDQRSQHKNREKAMQVLRARLYEQEVEKQHANIANNRRDQVGTGDRSERIRTYNFSQGRVSDHRINMTVYQLDKVLEGQLEPFIKALQADAHEKAMLGNT
ncbi:MAG TPA: peptide chain release factor 1 [Candidatus Eisenbacteria bacterium]|nr:peptide chain release factor 1 [Candidatus Eisenbacteria bacterium]